MSEIMNAPASRRGKAADDQGRLRMLVFGLAALSIGGGVPAQDWPMWGRDGSRNMVAAPEAQLAIPLDLQPGHPIGRTGQIDHGSTRHVKWITKLGSQTYGNPTIANGKVYVGTNNAYPLDTKYEGDRSVVYCLDEETGQMIWQLNLPKLGAGKVSDWEFLGICSSPAVDGDRVYVVTNLCEVVCLDANGLSDGNQGVTDEPTYLAGAGNEPLQLSPTDADVLWRYDMAEELGVFPHNISSNSPLIVGDVVWVATSNGVDWSHTNIPNPRAPALIGVDKNTGELVAEEASGISARMFHSNWSSPTHATIGGRDAIVWGAGDGFVYAFDARPVEDAEGFAVLREIWKTDVNPPHYRTDPAGEPIRYATTEGPSEVIGTCIVHDGKVYIAIGQDPEHGEGLGAFSCLDLQTGELIWQYTDINRSISTASVHDGLAVIADYAGVVHALDASTGKLHWTHDTHAHIWGSTLIAVGKVLVGNEDGYLTILAAAPCDRNVLAEIEFPAPIYCSPVVANGVLYIATQSHLYAFEAGPRAPAP